MVSAHGYDGLVLATLLAGIILLVAGLLKAGSLVRHVPEAVIHGFTIGIAIIIATSQLADLFGLHVAKTSPDFLEKVPALWAARGSFNSAALVVGLVTIARITVLRRLAPQWPADRGGGGDFGRGGARCTCRYTIGSRFGALPDHLPLPAIPAMSWARSPSWMPSALVIAFLAGIESLLSAVVADRMIGGSHRSNAEVLAQGWANLGSALFGGLPTTGAIARTATNVRAGGRTPVAGIVHALVILVVMMVAAPLAGYLAMPALAALLLLTAWNMSEPQKWRGTSRCARRTGC